VQQLKDTDKRLLQALHAAFRALVPACLSVHEFVDVCAGFVVPEITFPAKGKVEILGALSQVDSNCSLLCRFQLLSPRSACPCLFAHLAGVIASRAPFALNACAQRSFSRRVRQCGNTCVRMRSRMCRR